ncbi:hypothetical protein QFC21_005426 [Naganishia friedmannii]|uniref:Uncharacterized protein n=1 Tax=Naganishia friedmannii TaxID=89922 RepID=A0ACC2VB34_9TREE|nr:hypothetical protein QFC21_005426 [Naganishia friedmannii]
MSIMAEEGGHPSSMGSTVGQPHLVPISYHTTAVTDTIDIPVDLQTLEWNVRKCKALTAISCLFGGLSNVLSILYFPGFDRERAVWTYLELGFQSASLLSLLVSLLFAPSISLNDDSKRGGGLVPSHRSICIVNVLLTLSSIVLSLVRLYGCNLLSQSLPLPLHKLLVIFAVLLNVGGFFSAGNMRRGPKLYHPVPPMQLGSGLQATEEEVTDEVRLWLAGEDGGKEPEANVLDYDGCGVLDLTFAGYIAPIWRKSWTKPKLEESDLPQVPYLNRAQAVSLENDGGDPTPLNSDGNDGDSVLKAEVTFTPWGFLLHIWKGTSGFLFYGALLTALYTFLEFLPKMLDREIILLFETGDIKTPEGKQWGYLMVFGATSLRIASFVVSNYTDFLENYQLHGRIQMKMEQMLYGKLLRAYDPKYVMQEERAEEHERSPKERKLQMSRDIPIERDKRVSMIRELLQNIKAIKLNAWEEPFMHKAATAREQELRAIQTLKLAEAVLTTFDRWVPMLAIWLAYAIHTVIRGKPFPPSTALVAQKVFGGAIASLLKTPKIVSRGFSLHVSCERVATYLNGPELHNKRSLSNTVALRDLTAVWQTGWSRERTQNAFTLDQVTITFVPNSLNIITGPLGSGKSLLLLSILGETRILAGEIEAPRSMANAIPGLGYRNDIADAATRASWLQASLAYVPQIAYIEHGTVRANILFGEEFWEERYGQVVQACCLEEDFASWPDGDMTEVGEGGHSLSGKTMLRGQQSRINLARALYSRAQTILLDDPLSAVDQKTTNHLIANVLCGNLVKFRTVILTTHQTSLCAPHASQVIVLEAGRVTETLDNTRLPTTSWSDTIPPREMANDNEKFADISGDSITPDLPRQLITAEERIAGLSGRKYLASLVKSVGGKWFWTILLAIVTFNECIGIFHTAWLAQWSSDTRRYTNTVYAIGSLTMTIGRGLTMFCSSALVIFAFTWRASATVHQKLLSALLCAPLQTLQTVPTGRFLNRFTTDMQQFDMNLGDVVQKSLKMSFCIVVTLASTIVQVPALLLFTLALVPVLLSLQARLSKFLSDAKKINSIWKSPLLTMVNDSEHAVSVIRAFGSVQASTTRMNLLQTQQRIAGLTELCLQPVAILIPTTTGILVLQNAERTAAWAGYTLNIVQFVTQAVYDMIMQVGEIDVGLVTVERIEQCKAAISLLQSLRLNVETAA